jgi:hypothetical protein
VGAFSLLIKHAEGEIEEIAVASSLLSDPRLVAASAIVLAGFFHCKSLGLLRKLPIAQALGTGGDLDEFFAACFSALPFGESRQ